MMKMHPENKQQSKTLSNHGKEEVQWRKHERGQTETEKSSKSGANNGKSVMHPIQVNIR